MHNVYQLPIVVLLTFFSTILWTSSAAAMGDTLFMDVNTQSTMLCEGLIVDDGGFDLHYSDNQSRDLRIISTGAEGYILNFLAFETEECCDQLSITGFQDGVEVFFKTYRGNLQNVSETITADEVLINFTADAFGSEAGFVLEFQCLTPVIPVADFSTNSQMPCEPVVFLQDLTTGFPTSWTWSLDGTEVSTEQHPMINLPGLGSYDIELIACNALGCDTLEKIDYINYDGGNHFCDTFQMNDGVLLELTDCQGVLVDDGGANGDYGEFGQSTVILDVAESIGYQLDFKSFQTQNCCTLLEIYVDKGFGFEFVTSFIGDQPPNVLNIMGERLQIVWFAFGLPTDEGFVINYECQMPVFPVAEFTAVNTSICNNTVELIDQSNNFPTSWSWFLNNSLVSSDQNPTLFLPDDGSYDVELIACNTLGCDTLLKEDFIQQMEVPFCDTTWMPNNNSLEITSCQGVIYDQGGPDGNFEAFNNQYLRLKTSGGDGIKLTIKSLSIGTAVLEIYAPDVPNFFRSFSGALSEEVVLEVASNHLEFNFFSNQQEAMGFEITYECITAELPETNFEVFGVGVCGQDIRLINTSVGLPNTFTWKVNGMVFSNQSEFSFALEQETPTVISLTACNDIGCDSYVYPDTLLFDPNNAACADIELIKGSNQYSHLCEGQMAYDGSNEGFDPWSNTSWLSIYNPDAQGYLVTVETFDSDLSDVLFVYAGEDFNLQFVRDLQGVQIGLSFYTYGPLLHFEMFSESENSNFLIKWECQTDGIAPQLNPEISKLCNNEFAFFANAMGADQITWDFGDGNISVGDFILHTYAAAGSYTVVVTATNETDTTSQSFDIEADILNTFFVAPDTVLINTNHFVTLANHNSQEINSNIWFLDGNFLVSGTSVVIDLPINRDYILSCETIDNNGCFSTHAQQIRAVLSLSNRSPFPAYSFNIFPNPTSDKLSVTGFQQLSSSAQLTLRNTMGQQLINTAIAIGAEQVDLDLSEMASGIYFVEVRSAGQLLGLQKVMKL